MCLVFLRGRTTLDLSISVFLSCSLSLARMSLDQRLYPGVGGRKCGAFMTPLFRDPHPTCARCRGKKCTSDVTCDICKDWSVSQWEAFLKKRSYSGHRKSRPSGSSLPTVPPPLPSSASASLEAERPLPPPPPSSLPSFRRAGSVREVEGRLPRWLSQNLPSRRSVRGGG